MPDSRDDIRAARAAVNDAIACHDAGALGALLLPSYHVVTARSMQRDGKEASVRSWAETFERTSHAGTPDEIHVNDEWGMAEEHGRWRSTVTTNDGPLEIAGVYAAKWHLTPDGWRLQAEIFTPLTVARSASRGSGGTLL
jgi:ketosteroid isomerase-like protein